MTWQHDGAYSPLRRGNATGRMATVRPTPARRVAVGARVELEMNSRGSGVRPTGRGRAVLDVVGQEIIPMRSHVASVFLGLAVFLGITTRARAEEVPLLASGERVHVLVERSPGVQIHAISAVPDGSSNEGDWVGLS